MMVLILTRPLPDANAISDQSAQSKIIHVLLERRPLVLTRRQYSSFVKPARAKGQQARSTSVAGTYDDESHGELPRFADSTLSLD